MSTSTFILSTEELETNNETAGQQQLEKGKPFIQPVETPLKKYSKIDPTTGTKRSLDKNGEAKGESTERYLTSVEKHWLKAGEKLGRWLSRMN